MAWDWTADRSGATETITSIAPNLDIPAGNDPVITSFFGPGIELEQDNTIRGLTVDDTPGDYGIAGSAVVNVLTQDSRAVIDAPERIEARDITVGANNVTHLTHLVGTHVDLPAFLAPAQRRFLEPGPHPVR